MLRLKDIDRKKRSYNLKETWFLCLLMWKARAKNGTCKSKWLRNRGFRHIRFDCFLCDYQRKHGGGEYGDGECPNCPAVKIDPDFHCLNIEYHFCEYPSGFYEKLQELYNEFNKK